MTATEWACTRAAQFPRKQQSLLAKVNALHAVAGIDELSGNSTTLEVMERERSFKLREGFHLGDLEPGAFDRYVEAMSIVHLVLDCSADMPNYRSPEGKKGVISHGAGSQGADAVQPPGEISASEGTNATVEKMGNKKKARLAARERDRKLRETEGQEALTNLDRRNLSDKKMLKWAQSKAQDHQIPGIPSPAERDRQRDEKEAVAWKLWLEEDSQTQLTASQLKEPRWFWFLLETLSWLKLDLFTEDYNPVSLEPWPHPYVMHDLMVVYASMGLFFSNLDEACFVTHAVKYELPEELRASAVFDAPRRAQTLPKRRSPFGNKVRRKDFWNEWNALYRGEKDWAERCPMEWSLVIRPIVAKRRSLHPRFGIGKYQG